MKSPWRTAAEAITDNVSEDAKIIRRACVEHAAAEDAKWRKLLDDLLCECDYSINSGLPFTKNWTQYRRACDLIQHENSEVSEVRG